MRDSSSPSKKTSLRQYFGLDSPRVPYYPKTPKNTSKELYSFSRTKILMNRSARAWKSNKGNPPPSKKNTEIFEGFGTPLFKGKQPMKGAQGSDKIRTLGVLLSTRNNSYQHSTSNQSSKINDRHKSPKKLYRLRTELFLDESRALERQRMEEEEKKMAKRLSHRFKKQVKKIFEKKSKIAFLKTLDKQKVPEALKTPSYSLKKLQITHFNDQKNQKFNNSQTMTRLFTTVRKPPKDHSLHTLDPKDKCPSLSVIDKYENEIQQRYVDGYLRKLKNKSRSPVETPSLTLPRGRRGWIGKLEGSEEDEEENQGPKVFKGFNFYQKVKTSKVQTSCSPKVARSFRRLQKRKEDDYNAVVAQKWNPSSKPSPNLNNPQKNDEESKKIPSKSTKGKVKRGKQMFKLLSPKSWVSPKDRQRVSNIQWSPVVHHELSTIRPDKYATSTRIAKELLQEKQDYAVLNNNMIRCFQDIDNVEYDRKSKSKALSHLVSSIHSPSTPFKKYQYLFLLVQLPKKNHQQKKTRHKKVDL